MSSDIIKKDFDVTELEDGALDAVTGGGLLESVAGRDIDALGCTDNNTGNCVSGCSGTNNSGNCVSGCT